MGRNAEQTTLSRPVIRDGIGLHTGERCAVTLLPAEPDAGIVFAPGAGGAPIPAVVDSVVEVQRGTTLGAGGSQIGCVEHLLAALRGLRIDNVRAEVTGPEAPACDGSAREWVELLREAGRRRQGVERRVMRLRRAVWVGDEASWAVATPGAGGLAVGVVVDYPGTAAGRQTLWLRVTPSRFARELAPARTFAMAGELEALRARGLAQGGSAENAFAVGPEGYSGPLRFADEVVRHKALDLIGDLALCGWHLEGQVIAMRPSHRLNVALARALRAEMRGHPDAQSPGEESLT